MDFAHLRIHLRFELRRLLTSAPAILYLFFLLCIYAWIASKIGGLDESFREWGEAGEALGLGVESNPLVDAISWATDLSPASILELARDHSAVLLFVHAMTLFFVPFLALVVAADQTGSEISTRHVRFLTVRTHRSTVYVAKALAVWILYAGGFALVLAIVGVVHATGSGTAADALYLFRIWLSAVLFALPFIALLGAANALTGSAIIGLLATVGLWVFVWLLSGIGSLNFEAARHLQYLYPTALKFWLMSDSVGELGLALAHQLGFAALAFAGGITLFRRRDV